MHLLSVIRCESLLNVCRRVWFFRNGDTRSQAKLIAVNTKSFPNFESLLVHLDSVVPTVAGWSMYKFLDVLSVLL